MFTCKDFGTTDISEMTSSAVSPARYTYTALSFLKLALEYIPCRDYIIVNLFLSVDFVILN